MASRRNFIKTAGLVSVGAFAVSSCDSDGKSKQVKAAAQVKPIVISTWKNGVDANRETWNVLKAGCC